MEKSPGDQFHAKASENNAILFGRSLYSAVACVLDSIMMTLARFRAVTWDGVRQERYVADGLARFDNIAGMLSREGKPSAVAAEPAKASEQPPPAAAQFIVVPAVAPHAFSDEQADREHDHAES